MEEIIEKLTEIQNVNATQTEQIKQLAESVKKIESHFAPDGVVFKICEKQASCPKTHIYWIWGVMLSSIMIIIFKEVLK